MNLNLISIKARIRSPWEAIDLGFVMARQWWKPVFLSWFIPSFSLFLILSVIFYQYSWVAYTVVWWLKPLWDRGPLYVASRRLFGEDVSIREVLSKLPSLYKTDWLLWLTIRRFSISRSFIMPLTVLEQLKGPERAARKSVLDRQHSSAPSWLTIAAIHFEIVILFGGLIFVFMMAPETADISLIDFLDEQTFAFLVLYNVMTYLSMAIVGPFYALAGFSLYVSRRISLEAWDIEIRFRHLAASLSRPSRSVTNSLLFLLVCVCCQFSVPSHLEAAELSSNTPDHILPNVSEPSSGNMTETMLAKAQIIEILNDDKFHQRKMVSGWRLKDVSETSDEIPDWINDVINVIKDLINSLEWLADFFIHISPFIEYIIWGSVITLIVFVALYYRRTIHRFVQQTRPQESKVSAPTAMFGLDLRQESLPDDIPASVRRLWEEGNQREAVGLLYRALLSTLIHQHGFSFADGNTEGECASIVRHRGIDQLSHYMQRITRCWQQLAYGHLLPEFKQVDSLCDEWELLFPHE